MATDDLFAAVRRGDADIVGRLLVDTDSPPAIDAPDEAGCTAIFYSQMLGLDNITEMLSAAGWTPMDTSNLTLGAGGRPMFLKWCAAARAPAAGHLALSWPVRCSVMKRDKEAAVKDTIIARREARSCTARVRRRMRELERSTQKKAPQFNLNRDHPFYARKQHGCKRKGGVARPALHVWDTALAFGQRKQQLAAAIAQLAKRDRYPEYPELWCPEHPEQEDDEDEGEAGDVVDDEEVATGETQPSEEVEPSSPTGGWTRVGLDGSLHDGDDDWPPLVGSASPARRRGSEGGEWVVVDGNECEASGSEGRVGGALGSAGSYAAVVAAC